MLKINTDKRKTKKTVNYVATAALAMLLIVGGWMVYAKFNNLWPFTHAPTSSSSTVDRSTSSPESDGNRHKEDIPSSTDSTNVDVSKSTQEIPVSQNLSVAIENLAQANGYVSYVARASTATKGTCSALFTSEVGKPVARSSETLDGTCGASIPEMEFDSLGDWKLTLRFYSNNEQAVAESEISVK